jgi:hypothetical protein
MRRAHPAILVLFGRGGRATAIGPAGIGSSQDPDAQNRDAVSVTSASVQDFRKAASTSAASAVLPWARRL